MAFTTLVEPIRGRVRHHVLAGPRAVYGRGTLGVLPAGTVLRYRESLPDGGDYFEVIVRVNEILETTVAEDPTRISPIEMVPAVIMHLQGDALLAWLRAMGATRRDVEEVLPRLEE